MKQHESAMKSALVKEIKSDGHYARRFEDQFGVGILDMVVVAVSIGTVWVEGKIVRSGGFACTPRQRVEANRIVAAGGRAVAVGYDRESKRFYLTGVSEERTRVSECVERRAGEPFVEFIRRYYKGEGNYD